MKAPLICWRCGLGCLLIPALYAWLYPPARESLALLVLFTAGGLVLALGVPRLRDTWIAYRIRREGRRIRSGGAS